MSALTIDAIFVDGVFRPTAPLALPANQPVRITVNVKRVARPWPDDVAEIYRDTADEDRRLAAGMLGDVRSTWPKSEDGQ